MIPWLTPSMIASRASGILTFASTCAARRAERRRRLDGAGGTPRTPEVTSRITTGTA